MVQTSYKSGDVYGKLMLTGKAYMAPKKPKSTERFVECICNCGKIFFTRLGPIKRGSVVSCGCHKNEIFQKFITSHGESKHPLYAIWVALIQRCYNENNESFKNYGAMGVKVCEEWRNDFKPFYDWAIANGWDGKLHLDKDILYEKKFGTRPGMMYSPEFCSFVTRKQNSRALRTNHMIYAFGENKCIPEWVDDNRCLVALDTLRARISRGWDVEKAISSPSKRMVN